MTAVADKICVNTIPLLGNVAIVDDRLDEVVGLMNFLSKHSISFQYFDGKEENFPIEKRNIQTIFLDLNIFGNSDPKMLVSGAIANIQALISESNGPYCIGFWSNNYNTNKEIIDEGLNKLSMKPSFCFDMDKSLITVCKDNDEQLLKELNDNLQEGFQKNSLINAINIYSKTFSDEIVRSFSLINEKVLFRVNNSRKLDAIILYVLKKEYSKFYEDIDSENKINGFIPLFNKYLFSKIDNSMLSLDLKNLISFSDENISLKNIPDVEYNTQMIVQKKLDFIYPKNVYLSTNQDRNQLSYYLKKDLLIDDDKEVLFIDIDITHLCLIANKKEKFRTLVKGVLIENFGRDSFSDFETDGTKYLKKIYYEGKIYDFIIFCNKINSVLDERIRIEDAIFSITDKYFDYIRSIVSLQYSKIGI